MGKTSTVAVIGQGYVGLPLALEMVRGGHHVRGIDVNKSRIESLKSGVSDIDDVANDTLQSALATNRLQFFADGKHIQGCDVVTICVPTPLRASRDPDTSYIESAMSSIMSYLSKDMLIILESTTYPGTTREFIADPLKAAGYEIGKNIYVAFSPERVDPANKNFGIRSTPKVVGGMTSECTKRAQEFYQSFVEKVVTVESPEEAELVKLLENTFRSVNIALVNEFALLADRMKIDIWRVIQAAGTKPFGFMTFYPGPGIGGHCIPLDPVYLGWKAKSFGFYSRFIETATDINANMPRFILHKLSREANLRGVLMKNANVVIGGIAYKPNVRDARESPALDLMHLLVDEVQAQVSFVDPLITDTQDLKLPQGIKKITLEEGVRMKPDVFILVTPHSDIDWKKLAMCSRIVFDTRNAMVNTSKDHSGWIAL